MHNGKDHYTVEFGPRTQPVDQVAVETERHTITASLIKNVLERQADLLGHICMPGTLTGTAAGEFA